jgi:hypothetical protein
MKTITIAAVVIVAVVVIAGLYYYSKNYSNVSGLSTPNAQLTGAANEFPVLKMS